MIKRVGVAAAIAAAVVGTSALAQQSGGTVPNGRVGGRLVPTAPALPVAPQVNPATGTVIRPGFPIMVNGSGFLQTRGNGGAVNGGAVNGGANGGFNPGNVVAPSTAGGGQIGNPFSPAGAPHVSTGFGPTGAGVSTGAGVGGNPTAVSPGLQVQPGFGNGFGTGFIPGGVGAVVPVPNGATGVVMQNGQAVPVVVPHAGSKAFGTLRATDRIRFATDMTLEARMRDIRAQQAGDIRVGAVRTAPPAVGDVFADGDLMAENRRNRGAQSGMPRSLVAGSRQETQTSQETNERPNIVSDIQFASDDTQQLRLSAQAENIMEQRPMREGEIVKVGATGVVVRFDTDTRSRMERFPLSEVFFFNNGRMLTAQNAPDRLTVGSRVLIPVPVTTEIRESVAGSRQEMGSSTAIRSRTAGSRQIRRRPAK